MAMIKAVVLPPLTEAREGMAEFADEDELYRRLVGESAEVPRGETRLKALTPDDFRLFCRSLRNDRGIHLLPGDSITFGGRLIVHDERYPGGRRPGILPWIYGRLGIDRF